MPQNRYRELPVEALYELIVQLVGDLLSAADNHSSRFNVILKELNLVHAAIAEKSSQSSKKEI